MYDSNAVRTKDMGLISKADPRRAWMLLDADGGAAI